MSACRRPLRFVRAAVSCGVLALFLAGCGGTLQFASAPPYRPDMHAIRLPEPVRTAPPAVAARQPVAVVSPAAPRVDAVAPITPPEPAPAAIALPATVVVKPPVGAVPAAVADPAHAAPGLPDVPTSVEHKGPVDDARAAAAAGTVRRLDTGDSLVIYLYSREETHYDEVIDERGNVTLPYINAVRIAGMTSAEAEDSIKERYIKDGIFRQNLNVKVIAEARSFYIRGYVMRTGSFPLRPGMKLTQAIGIAGGPNEFGNEKRIKVLRSENGVTEEHNLEKIKDGKAPDPEIRPGDIIEVPQRPF